MSPKTHLSPLTPSRPRRDGSWSRHLLSNMVVVVFEGVVATLFETFFCYDISCQSKFLLKGRFFQHFCRSIPFHHDSLRQPDARHRRASLFGFNFQPLQPTRAGRRCQRGPCLRYHLWQSFPACLFRSGHPCHRRERRVSVGGRQRGQAFFEGDTGDALHRAGPGRQRDGPKRRSAVAAFDF